jgi:hypothetical protein
MRLIHSVLSSDLPGVNPAALNGMILYYRLMTKWSGLGDSTELSRVGLSQPHCKVSNLSRVLDAKQGYIRKAFKTSRDLIEKLNLQ